MTGTCFLDAPKLITVSLVTLHNKLWSYQFCTYRKVDGIEGVREIRQQDPDLPICLMGGGFAHIGKGLVSISRRMALKAGATDFLDYRKSYQNLLKLVRGYVGTYVRTRTSKQVAS